MRLRYSARDLSPLIEITNKKTAGILGGCACSSVKAGSSLGELGNQFGYTHLSPFIT
jgi:hypothetical protein